VLGDDHSRVFPVEIADMKTIGSLKEIIKDKSMHAFQRFDASLEGSHSAVDENVNNARLTDKDCI
jgi:hypothetical protein